MREQRIANLDLNLLVPLQALLRERNVTRAAAHVGVSQPAMSSSLKRLRGLLGDELLVRSRSGFQLTPRAEMLRGAVEDAISIVTDRIMLQPPFDPAISARRFKIGASTATIFAAMRSVMARSASENLNISFVFVDVTRSADVMLEDNDVDLILLPEVLPTEHPRERLYDEGWVFVASADNTQIGDELSIADLQSVPHAVYESAGLRTHAELTLASLGDGYRSVVMSNDFLTIFHLIPGSPLVACVQKSIAHELAERNGLRLVRSPVPLPSFGIDMVWNPNKSGDPALHWLRRELRKEAAARPAANRPGKNI